MKAKRAGIVLFVVGILAFCAAGGLWLCNEREEQTVFEYSEQMTQAFIVQMADTTSVTADEDTPDDMKYIILDDGEAYIGLLSIPALNINLPVNNTWSYEKLRNTPCRFSGDIETDSIVIAAHNYASHFRDIANLAPGELVILTDAEGNENHYSVAEIIIAQPADTNQVVNSDYDLTLFTCTYSGQARVVVRCLRMEKENIS